MRNEIKVLVVGQPWAWLIVNGHKDVENRTWRTDYRGLLAIQAAATRPSAATMEEALGYARRKRIRLERSR